MAELVRTELGVQKERALLMGVILPGSTADPMDPLGELRNLAKTAGANVVDEMLARRPKIDNAHYVGSGKAEEIKLRCDQNDVDTVIFDNDLSPAQIRNLENIINRKVLDRSELILDIFAAHAQTAESRLQVELAQLEYTYPRLHHMWSHLERIAGAGASAASAVGGIGTRGPGEKQIEIDRRLVQKRVSRLKELIDEIDRRKKREVLSREDVFSACLVGYTNAGKSTFMKLHTGADVLVADQLFATLDTKTARWHLGEGQTVLLSDTVGFIRDLPHHLVASFRATLEEALCANLLIHVADASHPRVEHQIKAVQDVLADLECDPTGQMLVLNKVDKLADPATRTILAQKYPQALFVSAATGEGADKVIAEVTRRSSGSPMQVIIKANYRNGRLMQYIAQYARVIEQTFSETVATIEARLPAQRVEEIRHFGKDVEVVVQKE